MVTDILVTMTMATFVRCRYIPAMIPVIYKK